MSGQRDGMNYVPESGATEAVVAPGDFVFAASHFDHGHIYGQIGGLTGAGGRLKYIYEPDASRHNSVLEQNPGCTVVEHFEQILEDDEVKLVTSAAVPCDRCAVGLQVMDAGKDYLTDKSPFTTLDQLEQAKQKVAQSGQKYMVCYSERLLNESGYHTGELIRQGAIGKVLSVINLAPHNLAAHTRPAWFFDKARYGGILTDIGSHQFEQFLTYTGATDGVVNFARVANLGNPEYPGLEDFGEASLTMDTGASCYCRLDWWNPAGLRSWGDGRTFIVGTKGSIEIRKYIDVARETGGNRIFLVDGETEQEIACSGKVGFPYFGQLILDVLNRTENAMTQAHAFKAAELSMRAQAAGEGQG
ncbi:MAG: Gfo/Idh/MocA family oxidoreductase [Verrucomicrobia bacterium]|nr:Gfo/Idh/MocA family oxidoreductase [Verrucomicrobiota bacterium]MBT7067897.1 Gfo/Idh/MocA family oxidoreductase [Verrucomicrobiota bacterium]MBT7699343.1 Gfo/Idh/MocA family oxidoreductase [Verrucomicrobiota bacterium]